MLGRSPLPSKPPILARGPTGDTMRLLAPSRTSRVRARLSHARLDREIAAGADLAASPLLAARAAQLVRPCRRSRLADGIEGATRAVERRGPSLRTPPRRQAIRRNREVLIELAAFLRSDVPAYARGIALLERVMTDGRGPAYTDHCGEALARQLRQARDSLRR